MEMVKCQKCRREIPRDQGLKHSQQILCEDCYIDATHRVQTCDPLAVRSAKLFRKTSGLEAADGLTDQQKAICQFIKSRGKVTAAELVSEFHISQQKLENQIAILRHCELVKGQKEGDKVYLTPF
jgi:late competence protein required for DNA uptake (superfamily II DNA/RNA helicase)